MSSPEPKPGRRGAPARRRSRRSLPDAPPAPAVTAVAVSADPARRAEAAARILDWLRRLTRPA